MENFCEFSHKYGLSSEASKGRDHFGKALLIGAVLEALLIGSILFGNASKPIMVKPVPKIIAIHMINPAPPNHNPSQYRHHQSRQFTKSLCPSPNLCRYRNLPRSRWCTTLCPLNRYLPKRRWLRHLCIRHL